MRPLAALASAAVLALAATGCVKQMLLDGQIEATRKASAAVDTISDYEIAQGAAFAGIAQIEGLHYLAPENEDALYMLTRTWAGTTFGFIEDLMEQAEDQEGTESPIYRYEQARARAGYDRAIHYGIELLEHRHAGFETAKRNDQTMRAWLANFDPSDAEDLFWVGYAWMSKTNVLKEEPAAVADLFIGVAIMERAVALDDGVMFGGGHAALGAYHARSPMAEMEEGKKELDKAIALTGGRFLMAKVQLAARYYCLKGDKANYVKTLTEVEEAGDVFPEHRLPNTIAKRRAHRYLGKPRMRACGF